MSISPNLGDLAGRDTQAFASSSATTERWGDFSSADQIWDTATWIHELSNYATLYPGDVLWMGTEGADGDMFPGDTIEVEINGIGTLRNYVVPEE